MTNEQAAPKTNFDELTTSVDALAAKLSYYRACHCCVYRRDPLCFNALRRESDEERDCFDGVRKWLKNEVMER